MTADGRTGRFHYAGHQLDASTGSLTCRYTLGDRSFVERTELGRGEWATPSAAEAARLVYLLAGVSYYKTAAPRAVRIDVPVRPGELVLVRDFYRLGLGEFAFRNGIDLSDIEFDAVVADAAPAPYSPPARPLVPFGGGIDSIVTVEAVKRSHPETSLFIVSPPTAPFAAIEKVVPVTGLPAARAVRHLDPQVLEPHVNTGFLQGHVPVTGIITALAVLAGVPAANAQILVHDGGGNGLASLYRKAGLPEGLLPVFRVAVDAANSTGLDGGERDLQRYRGRVITRILSQCEDLSSDDLDYLVDKLGDVLTAA